MQPTAGGVNLEAAELAAGYGYRQGHGARFISLPTHHTRAIAQMEGRDEAYLATTFHVPASGLAAEPVPAIMALCAARDMVFDCGHVAGHEAVALTRQAKALGLTRIRTHCSGYEPHEIAQIERLGGYCEFSFFHLSHATQVGLTHVDREKHKAPGQTIDEMAPRIRAAGNRAIVSSDAGVYLLAPPVESFRQFMLLLESAGFSEDDIRRMNTTNPIALFGLDKN